MSQSMYTQQELQPLVGPRNDRNTQLYYTLIVPLYGSSYNRASNITVISGGVGYQFDVQAI